MIRTFNRTSFGGVFGELVKQFVWSRARTVPGYDSALWRYDVCGDPICWHHYGDTSRATGWEIDHIFPVAKGGTDAPQNLQALAWENNRSKGDNTVGNYCVYRPQRSA